MRLFETSPIRRTKRAGFLRNVCVALGNRGDAAAIPALIAALGDSEALVRGHAAWALGELAKQDSTHLVPAVNALRRAMTDADLFARQEAYDALGACARA